MKEKLICPDCQCENKVDIDLLNWEEDGESEHLCGDCNNPFIARAVIRITFKCEKIGD